MDESKHEKSLLNTKTTKNIHEKKFFTKIRKQEYLECFLA